jgi:hypothetical protein
MGMGSIERFEFVVVVVILMLLSFRAASSPQVSNEIRSRNGTGEQLFHVRSGSLQRLRHQYPFDRLIFDAKRDGIPIHSENRTTESLEAFTPKIRTRIVRRLEYRRVDLLIRHDALSAPLTFENIV